jgi:hypothetical protein
MRIVLLSDGLVRDVPTSQALQCLKLGTATLEGEEEVVKKPKKAKK